MTVVPIQRSNTKHMDIFPLVPFSWMHACVLFDADDVCVRGHVCTGPSPLTLGQVQRGVQFRKRPDKQSTHTKQKHIDCFHTPACIYDSVYSLSLSLSLKSLERALVTLAHSERKGSDVRELTASPSQPQGTHRHPRTASPGKLRFRV